jgi:hypothetical protein
MALRPQPPIAMLLWFGGVCFLGIFLGLGLLEGEWRWGIAGFALLFFFGGLLRWFVKARTRE